MERVTISLEESLLEAFDGFIRRKGYENRSEAVRDLVRRALEAEAIDEGAVSHAVGSLSYVYNHHQRALAGRLTEAQHAHHDLMLSTLHVHLDHENCLEVVVLQGPTAEVRQFAEATIAETGVRHGHLHLVGADMVAGGHRHTPADHDHHHPHLHLKPRS